MIVRDLQHIIENNLFKGKLILLIGPRQVGKSTLLIQITEKLQLPYILLNCDEPEPRALLSDVNVMRLKQFIGSNKLVLIDEAQRVKNIGLTLKLIVDNFKDVQLIVTGSSSLELSNEINEPLTGRKYEYNLFPFSCGELVDYNSLLHERQSLEQRLIYGSYPEIINRPDEAVESLMSLTSSYLYKDILAFSDIRKPSQLEKLIELLALQIGSEVSYNELGQIIGANNQTVERYIDLLEQSFVVFRLGAFSNNLRNEIKKSRKIYFWDTGVRNAIIQNFSPLKLRQDTGALWENYFISERKKYNHYKRQFVKSFFWRSFQQQEVDLIEKADNELFAYEIKWNSKKKSGLSKTFLDAYPVKESHIINPDNYLEFLTTNH